MLFVVLRPPGTTLKNYVKVLRCAATTLKARSADRLSLKGRVVSFGFGSSASASLGFFERTGDGTRLVFARGKGQGKTREEQLYKSSTSTSTSEVTTHEWAPGLLEGRLYFVGRRSEIVNTQRDAQNTTQNICRGKAEEYCKCKVMRATRGINQQRHHQANGV